MGKRYAIIVAGGSGARMKSEIPKQFLELEGRPILVHTILKFQLASTDQIILVVPEDHLNACKEILDLARIPDVKLVVGGAERFDSVKNGLARIVTNDGVVAVHDAVRPMISVQLIDESFEQAERIGSAVIAVPLKDSIRELDASGSEAKDRSKYMLIQTPQTFDLSSLRSAYDRNHESFFTDDASVYEHAGHHINLVEGDYRNIKITTPEDLQVASVFIKE